MKCIKYDKLRLKIYRKQITYTITLFKKNLYNIPD